MLRLQWRCTTSWQRTEQTGRQVGTYPVLCRVPRSRLPEAQHATPLQVFAMGADGAMGRLPCVFLPSRSARLPCHACRRRSTLRLYRSLRWGRMGRWGDFLACFCRLVPPVFPVAPAGGAARYASTGLPDDAGLHCPLSIVHSQFSTASPSSGLLDFFCAWLWV